MSLNDAAGYAQRLYERIPANYRAYDAERGQPLLALMRTIAGPVSALRLDLDALWDNFFIETCDDWAVPYIGALVGTNLLARPVGQSNRLDVYHTIGWRRRKGTPAMLAELATGVTEWPSSLAEFFMMLGWSQNLNHVRITRTLTPNLRDSYGLSLLGLANDPNAHAADFRTSAPLDQPRVERKALTSNQAWGTPGRYTIKNLGFFEPRLRTFLNAATTPSAAPPGIPIPPNQRCYRFDPLDRDVPLFAGATQAPITRAAFARDPAAYARDVVVRQFGVSLARARDVGALTSGTTAFSFGNAGAGFTLDASAGMRLPNPHDFDGGGIDFTIEALWEPSGTTLGTLSTLAATSGSANPYTPGMPAPRTGALALRVTLTAGATRARFPGAVVALRAKQNGPLRRSDGVYVYLPPFALDAGSPVTYYVADDGTTYTEAALDVTQLARASEGPVYPGFAASASVTPVFGDALLRRTPGALRIVDSLRCAGSGALIEVGVLKGTFQPAAAIATATVTGKPYPAYDLPDPWPAFSDVPSRAALAGTVPDGLLAVRITPLGSDPLPPLELIVTNRGGRSVLVYLPDTPAKEPAVLLLVADDGGTYFAPADSAKLETQGASLQGLGVARPSAGQTLPIAGRWPLQQREAIAVDLSRAALVRDGELGLDPALGRFAFAPGDPAIATGALSVDYREGFSDRVGALNFDRQIDPKAAPRNGMRFVVSSGDAVRAVTTAFAGAPIHTSVVDAFAHAKNGEVIEIADSATYVSAFPALLADAAVRTLTLRAAQNQRPTLAFYDGGGMPAQASIHVAVPMDRLEISGVLIAGAPIQIDATVAGFLMTACSLDPASDNGAGMLVVSDRDVNGDADYVLCRCITGGIRAGPGVGRFTIADSIVDGRAGMAFDSLPVPASPPSPLSPPNLVAPSPESGARLLQLERVTVFGALHCEVLSASDCLLDDIALIDDRQRGCIRFSRYERGSMLPRRYQCVPTDAEIQMVPPGRRAAVPVFSSLRFGNPAYAQLAAGTATEMLTASDDDDAPGAFEATLNTTRLENLTIKLAEFMPVGLTPVVIAQT